MVASAGICDMDTGYGRDSDTRRDRQSNLPPSPTHTPQRIETPRRERQNEEGK